MRVQQIANNQVIVMTEEDTRFFSYERLIAIRDNDFHLYLSSAWDYSATTLKYFKLAFNLQHLTKKQIQKKLDDGEFFHLRDYKQK